MERPADLLREPDFWFYYFRATEPPLKNVAGEQVRLEIPCGFRRSVVVTITPRLWALELALLDDAGTQHSLGWWDDARWHPYAFRWEELEALQRHWLERPDLSIHPSAAFLLFVFFVGHGDGERQWFDHRRAEIQDHLRALDLFTESQIDRLASHALSPPSEEDYDWYREHDLGWIFVGDYPCCSIRNPQHLDGCGGPFPFAEWKRVVDDLPKAA